MPYIRQEERDAINALRDPDTPGQLSYILARAIDQYLASVPVDFRAIAEVVGVLETLKLEVYRRIGLTYEDRKRATNGEVFTTATDDDVILVAGRVKRIPKVEP